MGANRPRTSEKNAAEVVVLENLRNWRNRFSENPLDPELIQKGLLTLSEIGESALVQAVRYGRKVEEIHESQQGIHTTLELVQSKLDTTISRLEGSSSVQNRESESVADELRGLHLGVEEVKDMAKAILDHFGIQVPVKSKEK